MMFLHWLEKKCFPNRPKVASAEQWVEIHKIEKSKHIRNLLVNTVPQWFSVKKRQINDIKYWVLYRTKSAHKYHLIDTGLKPNYYEIDTRMLHGMFNLLKNFCEYESAHHDWMWSDYSKKIDAEKQGLVYNKTPFVPGKQAALETLQWRKQLVYTADELCDEQKHMIGKPTPHAITSTEIETLYLWWVDVRPNRVDPFEAYPDPLFEQKLEKSKSEGIMTFLCAGTEQEELEQKQRYEKIDALQKQYECEDDEMLTRLIKIRKTLWT